MKKSRPLFSGAFPIISFKIPVPVRGETISLRYKFLNRIKSVGIPIRNFCSIGFDDVINDIITLYYYVMNIFASCKAGFEL